jgi:hypothetical protein
MLPLACACVIIGSNPVWAGSVTNYQASGASAHAQWYNQSVDPANLCVISYTSLDVYNNVVKKDASASTFFLAVSSYSYNFCTGDFPYSLSGFVTSGYQFTAKTNSSSASVSGTIPVCVYTNNTPPCQNRSLVVNITWTQTGNATSSHGIIRQETPGSLMIVRSQETSAVPATASGSFTLDGNPLLPGDVVYASIDNIRQATLTIYH